MKLGRPGGESQIGRGIPVKMDHLEIGIDDQCGWSVMPQESPLRLFPPDCGSFFNSPIGRDLLLGHRLRPACCQDTTADMGRAEGPSRVLVEGPRACR